MPDTKISLLTDAGALAGTEIVPLANGAANERTTTQAIANLAVAGGGGLYGPVLSAVPTTANTGLSTWVNQGTASVSDVALGITIVAPNDVGATRYRVRSKVAPATPYTISALIAANVTLTDFVSSGICWHDGTKFHSLAAVSISGVDQLAVQKMTSATVFSANDAGPTPRAGLLLRPFWFILVDDGTNVKFGMSTDGVAANAVVLFSVAKASGWLGASGYTNVGFFANGQGANLRTTLMSWQESAGAAF